MKRRNRISTNTLIFVLLPFLFLGCNNDNSDFTLTNDSEIDREDEPIILSRDMITEKLDSIPDGKIPVPYIGEEDIPTQADDIDMDGQWDELAFTLTIAAGESKRIALRFVDENEYPEFIQKTNVRFGVKEGSGVNPVEELTLTADELPVPPFGRFQMDGPAWENDKVGFRQYIDGRNGRDLYGKTSSEMALETVGISEEGELVDNYHEMLPWGRDILAVGNSLGLGGLGIMQYGEPTRLGIRMDAERNNVDTTKYQLITEGPVRSIFRLTYSGWDLGNRKINLVNDVSIWAGTYSHTNKVKLTNSDASDTLVVGLVNIHNDNPPELIEGSEADYSAFYTHDQQTYDKGWFLGMGLIFPDENYLGHREAPDSGLGVTNSFLTLFELEEDEWLEYHVFAGWELSDEKFQDENNFRDFISTELQKIAKPVSVE
ncbi:MAG: DUF4861 domain-containing protein [Balneolaceae bacterium]